MLEEPPEDVGEEERGHEREAVSRITDSVLLNSSTLASVGYLPRRMT